MTIRLYDTTLRDGTQREGLSLSVEDKLKIARLDGLGVQLHRGRLAGLEPQGRRVLPPDPRGPAGHAKLAAFGSTRRGRHPLRGRREPARAGRRRDAGRHGGRQELDAARRARAGDDAATENLRDDRRQRRLPRGTGGEVVYDAEHFFDGYRADPDYALATLPPRPPRPAPTGSCCATRTAASCPDVVAEIVHEVRGAHRDAASASTRTTTPGSAVANALAAVARGLRAGAGHDQRLRRALRQPRSRAGHRRPPAQARHAVLSAGVAPAG